MIEQPAKVIGLDWRERMACAIGAVLGLTPGEVLETHGFVTKHEKDQLVSWFGERKFELPDSAVGDRFLAWVVEERAKASAGRTRGRGGRRRR